MSEDQNPNNSSPTLEITADEQKGIVSGSGTLSLNISDAASLKASYENDGEGNTKVTLGADDSVALFEGDNLFFSGHVDLDPRTKLVGVGTQFTFTVPNKLAIDLKAQIAAGMPSGSLEVRISL